MGLMAPSRKMAVLWVTVGGRKEESEHLTEETKAELGDATPRLELT